MSIKKTLFLLLLPLFFSFPVSCFAVLDIQLTPEIPGPYEEVTAEIVGYIIDIDRSEVYWYQDQIVQKQGVGERTFQFFTKGIGTSTVIDVVIVTNQGRRIDKQIRVEPIEVDILWEADTYTPPFYRGKALPTYNSTITSHAIPNTSNQELHNFIYTWKDGYFNIAKDYSGYERNSFPILAQLAPYRKVVEVEVISADKSKRAKNTTFITSVEPELLLYNKKPLSGIDYTNNIDESVTILEDEFHVYVEPFFFSRNDVLANEISYRWVANGQRLFERQAGGNEYVFGRPSEGEGAALIEIFVLNNAEWIQKKKKELRLFY